MVVVALTGLGTTYQSAAAYLDSVSSGWLCSQEETGFMDLGILFNFTFTVKYDTQCYISNYLDMFYSQFMLQCQRIVVRVSSSHKID